ncbi:hypothetical protein IIM91_004097 [Escherichia coli]|nr:hypothetical protein [Escherichia coli]
MFAGKKSAQIREILINESAWEEMTCLFAPSLTLIAATLYSQERFDNGQIYSAWHLLPVPEEVDDQDYEFESYDLEVEALAQAGEKT